ncbi:MAG: glucose-1-phosphate adenylyltransferase subunit GlgD [Oscillospiraceae bacterium]|nr:glucose-1-phosphate adenylyltransferase subunit GlgD [Oscillospiraceae bacterium]
MANMSNVLGLIFANMHELTVTDLTKNRAMASIPFGARYRLIDFPLSNMVNSGVNNVGVVTKSNYQSLLDHIGSGDEWDLSRKTGGLHFLPPYSNNLGNGGLYRGRLEALAGVINFIKNANADYVVMTDCDCVANVDYKKVVDFHEEQGADITVVYGKKLLTPEQTKTRTILKVSDQGEVCDVLIRPDMAGEFDSSMNIFVMSKEFLMKTISESVSRNLYSFEVDILQHKLGELKVFGYRFDGYYSQIDGIQAYYQANMDLMSREVRNELFNLTDPIYTKVRDDAPAVYGLEASAKNSLIADGCVIEGTVENSVLFRGVKVGKGAVIKNCILMQDAEVGDKCELNYVIADKNVKVGNYRSLCGTVDYPVFVNKNSAV